MSRMRDTNVTDVTRRKGENMKAQEDFELDHCYECRANGDDYILNGADEWMKACDDCPYNDALQDPEDE